MGLDVDRHPLGRPRGGREDERDHRWCAGFGWPSWAIRTSSASVGQTSAALRPQALQELGQGVAGGSIRYRESIADGIASAPEAFLGLLEGRNFGKQLVKLA